ncbi:MAG: hypothetical protein QM757_25635 [Paludibaculum sp.]
MGRRDEDGRRPSRGHYSSEPGTVFHTFGYPEPEIFGFLYVHPGSVAPGWDLRAFVVRQPVRTAYRYLQH